METFKKRIVALVKIIILLLPLFWVLSRVDFVKTITTFSSVPFWVIPSFLALFILRMWLQTYRFQYLSRLYTRTIRVTDLFIVDMKSRYLSMVIPSSVGQDIVRGTLLRKALGADQIVSISLFFRITGLLPFLVFSLFGIVQLSSQQGFIQFVPTLIISTILFVGGFVALYSRRISRKIGSLFPKIIPDNVTRFLRNIVLAFQQYRREPRLMLNSMIVSFIAQFLSVFLSMVVIKGITGEWYALEMMAFIPLIELLAVMVPFAPNGIGVREIMYIMLFSTLNHTHEEMLVYIAINAISHLVNMTGVIPLLIEKRFKKAD